MHTNLRVAWGSVALVAALALAACSGSAAESPSSSAPAADLPPGAQTAADNVKAAQAAVGEFAPPGPAFDASKAEGKLVYYIPASAEIQVFNEVREFVKTAFAPYDITVQECAAQGGSPTSISNCLNQAVQAGADAVITMSIPYQLAPSAFDEVFNAGIPAVLGLIPGGAPGDATQVGYFAPDLVQLQKWNADWIIADSAGTANVLVVQEDANPAVQSWTVEGTLPEYEELCPDCNVTVVGADVTQQDKLTSDTTSKVVADPSTDYFQSVSGNHLPAVLKGLQAAAIDPASANVTTMDGDLSSMTQLSQGQWLKAVSGWSTHAGSWYIADQTLRLLSGEPAVENAPFPYLRLFTSENVGELELTPEAWENGDWYGSTDFQDGFRELWQG